MVKDPANSNSNYGYYRPSNPLLTPEKLTQNIQLLLEVKTRLKLDIVDQDGRALLEMQLGEKAEQQEEVHYVLVENVIDEYQMLSWKMLFKPFVNLLKLNKQIHLSMILHSLKKGWVITDFDGCLTGNPRD